MTVTSFPTIYTKLCHCALNFRRMSSNPQSYAAYWIQIGGCCADSRQEKMKYHRSCP